MTSEKSRISYLWTVGFPLVLLLCAIAYCGVARYSASLNKVRQEQHQLIERYKDTVLHYKEVADEFESKNKVLTFEPNFTDIVAQSVKSVVHIRCPQWQGSGFIIDEHIICTARHVVEDVEDFTITFNDGTQAKASKAISDKEHDVGFIWVEKPMTNVAKLGSIKGCKLGQDVFIIGSPYGDINFNAVSKGIISGLNRDWDEVDPYTGETYGWEIAFTSDSAAHPGNSGGAVFTLDGVVRGILVGGFSPVLNCSMPVDLFLPDIEQIKLMFVMDKYQFESEKLFREQIYSLQQQFDFLKSVVYTLHYDNSILKDRIEALEEQIQILENQLILEHVDELVWTFIIPAED